MTEYQAQKVLMDFVSEIESIHKGIIHKEKFYKISNEQTLNKIEKLYGKINRQRQTQRKHLA